MGDVEALHVRKRVGTGNPHSYLRDLVEEFPMPAARLRNGRVPPRPVGLSRLFV
jgi:hypothetical protein